MPAAAGQIQYDRVVCNNMHIIEEETKLVKEKKGG